jgi:hypothetical protein
MSGGSVREVRIVKKLMIVFLGVVLFWAAAAQAASWPDNLSRNERRRLRTLMQNTWEGLDQMCAELSGLPFESTLSRSRTTSSTIGLYLASLCVANRLGYIREDEAIQRIGRILSSLDTLPHWNRLYADVLPANGQDRDQIPGGGELAAYMNLPAGMMVVRSTFPRLARRCTEFLDTIPWTVFYDRETDRLYRRFDIEKKSARDPAEARMDDGLRLAHFLMIASQQVPPSTWPEKGEDKNTPLQPIYGSLFVDPRGTCAGKADMLAAWHQIEHALNIGAPVWGWDPEAKISPAEAPTFPVIHPYVSAQALPYFPREVLHNFEALEEMGALTAPARGIKKSSFGFCDFVNWRTGEMAKYYSTAHQARLFLAMANYLERSVLWRAFQSDPLARAGLRQLANCRGTEYKRTLERKFIRTLSRKMPATFWWFRTDSLTPMAGDLLQASLWAKSLSPEPLKGYTEHWRLTDRAGRVMAEGEESFDLAPREARKLTEIMIPTARLRPGIIWTLKSELRQDGKVLATMERDIRFRRRD